MSTTVLLLGGTGRTGRQVLSQLLERGVRVRALVRSADRLPQTAAGAAGLTVIEAGVRSLPDEELQALVRGCDAVVSCLGHNLTLQGIYGSPRDLVTQATTRVHRALEALRPAKPVKFVLMSSVSVNQPAGRDARRGWFERGVVALVRGVLPPAKDNQRAADFLCAGATGAGDSADPFLEWVAVRPDTLLDGPVTEYSLHEDLVSSLFRPDSTNRANVAHFMCELVQDRRLWEQWKSRLPVVINAASR